MRMRLSAWWMFLTACLVPAAAVAQGQTGSDQTDERAKQRKVTKRPKLVEQVDAEYTEEAIEAGVEGKVVLRIRIEKTGEVGKVKVVEGLGHGLDAAAVEAMKQFKFEPAEVDGKPAAVVLNFTMRFTLPERPATLRGQVVRAEQTTGQKEGAAQKEAGLSGATVQIRYTGPVGGQEAGDGDGGDGQGGGEAQSAEERTATTVTDEQGRFEFSELPPGPYEVKVSVRGYQDRQTRIELGNGEAVEVQYAVRAEPVNFAGQVREAGTRKPLSGVEITVRDPKKNGAIQRQIYSEKGGRFAVRGLEEGTWKVRLKAPGYRTETVTETIDAGKRTEVTYYIKAESYDAFKVTTTAEREQETISRKTVELEEIRRIPGSGGDPVRAVQNLPGVARPAFGAGQLVVRGATPQSTKTFIQGDEIPLIYHFFGGPSVVSAEMIDSVDFYPGNFRARFGRALAGVVNLQTRSPKMDRVHGYAELDVLDATAQVEGPIGEDVGFALSARRSYIDAILPAVIPEDQNNFSVAPRYYDYQGWLTWEVSGQHKLELFTYGSNDRVAALFDEDDPPGNAQFQSTNLQLTNAFYRGQVRWEWRPDSGDFENDLMVSYGVNDFGFEAARNLYFDLTYNQFQIREDFRWDLSDRVEFNAGLDMQAGWSDFSAEFPDVDTGGDPTNTGGGGPAIAEGGAVAQGERVGIYYPAMYSELEITPVEGLEFIPGIRMDYYNQIEDFAHSPRLNTRWELSDLVALKGGVGLFTQPPNPGQTAEVFGNPELTYQKAMQYAVGVEVTPLEFLEIDTTLFYQDLWDLVATTDAVRRDEETGETEPIIYNNAGQGRAWGMEFLVRHRPANNFFGWLAYTLSWSQRKNLKNGDWQPFEFDQRHILTLVGGYNLPWNIDVSARFRLVSGNPETPVVGSVYNVDSDEYEPVYGQPNSVRADTFHQLDLRVDKQFVFDTWRLGVYVDVINVYNATNQEGTRYNYDYSESEPVRGLPIIPTLGINGRF